MKVQELIRQLGRMNPEARVFMGYDNNIVVTESDGVEEMHDEAHIGPCWYSVQVGDVVILGSD